MAMCPLYNSTSYTLPNPRFESSVVYSRCEKCSISCHSSPPSLHTGSISGRRIRKLPILLFDVMDTIVRDPFYQDVPAFFGLSMEELLEQKNPTAWIQFEHGLIDEAKLARSFFKDERFFELEGLKVSLWRGYKYIDGVKELLQLLKKCNYEIHAFTNYPIWYRLIEEKLKLSTYLSWTFCSCLTGKRKPNSSSYMEVLAHLGVHPQNCVFIDDRVKNIEVANGIGMIGIHFINSLSLFEDLRMLGIIKRLV